MDETQRRIGALFGHQQRTLDVGLDLDGCFVWFDRAYYDGCIKIGTLDQAAYADHKATRWNFYSDLGHSTAEFLANCDRLADLGLLWSGPMIPGSATVWDSIIDAGHRVHVLTDRPFGSHPIASQVATRIWLTHNQRRFHSLTFTADKTAVPTDLMLEDKIENYDALAETACTPWLINRPWNQVEPGSPDPRRRVDSHDEFLFQVLTMGAGRQPAVA